MNTNQKKINVLEKAIKKLKNGFHYSWGSHESCNCGVVLSAAGATAKEFSEYTQFPADISGSPYSEATKAITGLPTCLITGLPLCKIQKIFLEIGFSKKDIQELEMLSNDDVLNRLNISGDFQCNKKENLITYLRAWVAILKESETPKVIYKVVHVDRTISEQAKELLTPEIIAQ